MEDDLHNGYKEEGEVSWDDETWIKEWPFLWLLILSYLS